MKKRILSLSLALVMLAGLLPLSALPSAAQIHSGSAGANGANVTWTLDTTTGELVISGTGPMYDGWDFFLFSWYAHRSIIDRVVIEYGVTSIGYGAFLHHTSLTEVVIPDSVTSISFGAFSGCTSLTGVVIPASVTSMGYNVLSGRDYVLGYDDFGVFYQCTSLTSITVDVNNPNYASIDGVLLDKSLTVLIQYPQGNTRATYTIPNSVTHIGYRAFNFSAFLTSVVIPNSVTRIERSAFMDCHSLTSVVIPSSVTHIGSVAFNFCYSLYDVYFESLIPPAVDFAAFSVVSPSARAIVPHGATAYGPVGSRWNGLIVTYLCPGCGKAPCEPCGICGECPCEVCPVDIVVGHTDGIATSGNVDTALSEAGLTRTGSRPFTVTFAPGVTSIGSAAFFNCVFLTEVVIGNSVTSIGNNAFQSCTSLTEVVIPDSVTSIGNSAFQNCTSLTEVVIPDSVTSIGNSAFAFCDSLTSVVIGNSVTSIGDGAFFWCPELYEVYFQSETPPTTVGVNAFTGVKPGAMAIVPHGVTAYGAVGDLWNGLVVTWGCEDCGKVPCECRVVNYGDIDGDGRIAANDVTLLRRYIAAACKDTFKAATPFFNEANAHVRGKPCINAADVTLLRKYIASGNNDVLVPLGPPAA